ncbi:LOG family protein YvdD [Abditibacteriota bacterium]|nr:LOG family protein YvdD [Abditibacteriota bacterium]
MKTLCVYCGSNAGARPNYLHTARQLGHLLVERQIGLVYGGASVGMMGAIANAVLSAGGHVTGVIPADLVDKEIAHKNLPDLRVVGSMHERKQLMADLSDGFIALPGGLGTFEEFFEVVTWGQLGFHTKPCGLLNVCGYYDKLLDFLDSAVQERLVRPEHRAIILQSPDAAELLEQMAAYQPPTVEKWLDRRTA